MSKHFKERDLDRRGALETWGRTWRSDTVVAIKREHVAASELFLALLLAHPDPALGIDERAAEYYRALDAASRVTERIRDRMCKLASAAKTGRPRKEQDDAVDVTPMPAPEVAQPPGDPQPPL